MEGSGFSAAWSDFGGQTSSPIAAASDNDGNFDVFVRGANGRLQNRWLDNGRLSGWTELSTTPLTSVPVAYSFGPGRVDVFSMTTAPGGPAPVWYEQITCEGTRVTRQKLNHAGSMNASTPVAVASYTWQQLAVAAFNADGSIRVKPFK